MKEQTNKTPAASASRHTPEPWQLLPGICNSLEVIAASPHLPEKHMGVCQISRNCWDKKDAMTNANAARIVDCVNALAGMNPEAVKPFVDLIVRLHRKMEVIGRAGATNHPAVKCDISGLTLGDLYDLNAALAALKGGK